jgi:4-oxalomesaconate tautomerase
VPGTSAPIEIAFLETEGSVCGTLLPTGQVVDVFDGVATTCIDNGMPVVLIAASEMEITGYESCAELNANTTLKTKLESIRLQAGPRMNLGDVTKKVVPKMCLVAPARAGGTLSTRTFIPHDCHSSIGVLGAVTVATGALLSGSAIAHLSTARVGENGSVVAEIEHPTGSFHVSLDVDSEGQVRRAALLRTARCIMRGEVII